MTALGLMIALALFIVGSCLGSFLNVVILRFLSHQPLTGRSRCWQCQQQLRWWELIPIVSFLALRGHCHRCQQPIAWQYPLVEGLAGLATVRIVTPMPATGLDLLAAALLLLIIGWLIILCVIDWRVYLLPDIFIMALSLTAFLWLALKQEIWQIDWLIGLGIGGGFLSVLWLITRGHGIGLGDVKLLLPLGALLGSKGVIALLWLAFMSGGVVAVWLLWRRQVTVKTAIPFGPFLIGAAGLLLLFPSLTNKLFSFWWPGSV